MRALLKLSSSQSVSLVSCLSAHTTAYEAPGSSGTARQEGAAVRWWGIGDIGIFRNLDFLNLHYNEDSDKNFDAGERLSTTRDGGV